MLNDALSVRRSFMIGTDSSEVLLCVEAVPRTLDPEYLVPSFGSARKTHTENSVYPPTQASSGMAGLTCVRSWLTESVVSPVPSLCR